MLLVGLLTIPAAAAFDFGGETVYLGQSVWFGEQYNRITNENFADPRWEAHWEDIEAMFNVNLEWDLVTSQWPYTEAINYLLPRVIAGEGNVIAVTTDTIIPILVANNLIMPVTEWINEDYFARLPAPLKPIERFTTFLGENWAFAFGPRMGTEAAGIFFNKDIIEQYGLPDPYELYANGEWTWDAFEQIAIAATKDTDGDGEIDQWGVEIRDGRLDYRFQTFWVYTNEGALVKEVDGKVIYDLNSDAAIESYEFWYRLITEHNTVSDTIFWAEFSQGNVALYVDFAAEVGRFGNVDFNFGFVPLPKGPRADKHVAIEFARWVAVLPITAQNPEALIELWHALYNLAEPYIDDLDYWEEEYYSNVANYSQDLETYENIVWVTENAQPAMLLDVFSSIPGFTDTVVEILSGETEASVGLAAIEPAIQAYLDELFDQ